MLRSASGIPAGGQQDQFKGGSVIPPRLEGIDKLDLPSSQ